MISYEQILILAGRYLDHMLRAQRMVINSSNVDRVARSLKLWSSFSAKYDMLNILTRSINTGGKPGQ